MTNHNVAAAALLALATFAAPSTFAASSDVTQIVVRTGDLNLQTESGVRVLYQRLKFAAADLCPTGGREAARAIRARECQAAILDRTVAEAQLPRLAALHRQRGGNPAQVAHR